MLEYAKQIVFWDKGKGNYTYKGLLNYWITLKQHELDKAQEQARPSSIHAYEVDSVLSKCHMLPIPPKKTVCAQKHYCYADGWLLGRCFCTNFLINRLQV